MCGIPVDLLVVGGVLVCGVTSRSSYDTHGGTSGSRAETSLLLFPLFKFWGVVFILCGQPMGELKLSLSIFHSHLAPSLSHWFEPRPGSSGVLPGMI